MASAEDDEDPIAWLRDPLQVRKDSDVALIPFGKQVRAHVRVTGSHSCDLHVHGMSLPDPRRIILQTENLTDTFLLLTAIPFRRHLGRRLLDTPDESGIMPLRVLHHCAERKLSAVVSWIHEWMAEAFGEPEAELLYLTSVERVAPRTICRIQAIHSRGLVGPYLDCDLRWSEPSERIDDLLDLSLLGGSEYISHFGLYDVQSGIVEVVGAEDEDLRMRVRRTGGLLRDRGSADEAEGQEEKAAGGAMTKHASDSERGGSEPEPQFARAAPALLEDSVHCTSMLASAMDSLGR